MRARTEPGSKDAKSAKATRQSPGALTNSYVADWVGELVSIGATISAFGAALGCVLGASRILFALGRDTGPKMLTVTTRAGAPAVALIGVAMGSLVTLCCWCSTKILRLRR